jgi:hypothetical protein
VRMPLSHPDRVNVPRSRPWYILPIGPCCMYAS